MISENYDEGTITLDYAKVKYTQDLDSCQSDNGECQVLTIETDDAGGGKFYRMFTGSMGWSFNDLDELVSILKDMQCRTRVLK